MKKLLLSLLLLAFRSPGAQTTTPPFVIQLGAPTQTAQIVPVNSGGDLSATVAAASAGQTIMVYPGNYTARDLLKNEVNWFFFPGANVTYSNVGVGSGMGIFDDRGHGAITSNIAGSGTFTLYGYTNNAALGAVVVTNVSSAVSVHAAKIRFATYNFSGLSLGVASACCIRNGNNSIESDIEFPLDGTTITIGLLHRADSSTGLYWEQGQCYFKGNINHCGQYGIWASLPTVHDAVDHNLWITSDHIDKHCYMNGPVGAPEPRWRTWWNVKQQSGGWSIYSVGRHYIDAEKVYLNATAGTIGIDTVDEVEVWLTCQKMTQEIDSSYINLGGNGNSVAHIFVQHFEDTFGSAHNAIGINVGGALELFGGVGRWNGKFLRHASGTTRIIDATLICTGSTVNDNPVILNAPGCIIQNSTLVAPTTTSSINAASAQTVGIYGSVMASRPINANVTLSPLGQFTVDANVR